MFSKIARLATRDVRYLEAGSGRPILFLHAFPLSADQWLPQLAQLPPGWRGVAPDLRGLGGSDVGLTEDGRVTIDTYASDALELMAHVEMPQAVVCGLSMGGYVAFAMLRQAPQRVTGLVLADTKASADTTEGRAGRDRMLALVAAEGSAAVAADMLPKLLGETTRREQPDLVDVVRRTIEGNKADGIAAAVAAMRDRPDSTDLLGTLASPTLIVVGEEDRVTGPAEAAAMHSAIAGATMRTVARAGHLSNLENPKAFNAVLTSWLMETPALQVRPSPA